MIVYKIAIAILLFSALTTVFNELDVFPQKVYDPHFQFNESETAGIHEIGVEAGAESNTGLLDKLADSLGLGWLIKAAVVVEKTLGLALNMGSLFETYVPGTVGSSIAVLVNTLTYAIYVWGGVQLWRKVSSKQMD